MDTSKLRIKFECIATSAEDRRNCEFSEIREGHDGDLRCGCAHVGSGANCCDEIAQLYRLRLVCKHFQDENGKWYTGSDKFYPEYVKKHNL